MFRRCLALIFGVAVLGAGAGAQIPPASQAAKTPLVERVGDTGFLQLESPSFAALDDRQKAMAYWLTQAAIAIDPIVYDQLSRFGLRQKRLIEGVMAHQSGIAPAAASRIREYEIG